MAPACFSDDKFISWKGNDSFFLLLGDTGVFTSAENVYIDVYTKQQPGCNYSTRSCHLLLHPFVHRANGKPNTCILI